MPEGLSGWLSSFNVFNDIDFSILYDWLPSDVQSVIGFCLSFIFVLCVIGLIRKFLLR
mgnify:CR=1 FL=1